MSKLRSLLMAAATLTDTDLGNVSDYDSTVNLDGLAELFLIILGVAFIVALILAIPYGIVLSKAGSPFIAAFIPVWGSYEFFKILGMKKWFWIITILSAVVQFIPGNLMPTDLYMLVLYTLSVALSIVSLIAYVKRSFKLAKAFDKSVAFGIGLLLFEPLFMLILAFSKADYSGVPN